MLLHVHQKVSGFISIQLKINNILVVKLYINIKYWYTEIQILVLYLNKQHAALTYTLKQKYVDPTPVLYSAGTFFFLSRQFIYFFSDYPDDGSQSKGICLTQHKILKRVLPSES